MSEIALQTSGGPRALGGIGDAAFVTQTMRGASVPAVLGATSLVVATIGYGIPSAFTLKSADATRKIEFSTDGGSEYFTPAYDVVSATMLSVTAFAGISHVRFTGLTTDTWSVS